LEAIFDLEDVDFEWVWSASINAGLVASSDLNSLFVDEIVELVGQLDFVLSVIIYWLTNISINLVEVVSYLITEILFSILICFNLLLNISLVESASTSFHDACLSILAWEVHALVSNALRIAGVSWDEGCEDVSIGLCYWVVGSSEVNVKFSEGLLVFVLDCLDHIDGSLSSGGLVLHLQITQVFIEVSDSSLVELVGKSLDVTRISSVQTLNKLIHHGLFSTDLTVSHVQ
jgi:hypothetical protein